MGLFLNNPPTVDITLELTPTTATTDALLVVARAGLPQQHITAVREEVERERTGLARAAAAAEAYDAEVAIVELESQVAHLPDPALLDEVALLDIADTAIREQAAETYPVGDLNLFGHRSSTVSDVTVVFRRHEPVQLSAEVTNAPVSTVTPAVRKARRVTTVIRAHWDAKAGLLVATATVASAGSAVQLTSVSPPYREIRTSISHHLDGAHVRIVGQTVARPVQRYHLKEAETHDQSVTVQLAVFTSAEVKIEFDRDTGEPSVVTPAGHHIKVSPETAVEIQRACQTSAAV
jgi:hypothetical protein